MDYIRNGTLIKKLIIPEKSKLDLMLNILIILILYLIINTLYSSVFLL